MHAYIAHTKYPNSIESDKQPVVMHVVTLTDGTQLDVLAAAPDDAIRIVNSLGELRN